MVHVAVYSGLRVSELIALRWNDVGYDSLVVDERYHRGDWSAPKGEALMQRWWSRATSSSGYTH